MNTFFDQSPYEIKLEWGIRGAREAAKREEILIIVDVLSFSSTVIAALENEAVIYPFPPPINEKAKKYADQLGAELVVGRAEAIETGKHSLSPNSFTADDCGKSYVLCSLNGAACVEVAKKVPALLLGSLRNAQAVAEAALEMKKKIGKPITIIACGERWEKASADENELRPAIEDYLGAGAIISSLNGSLSPEVFVCKQAYQGSKHELSNLIRKCGSGRELAERGFAKDVDFCLQLNSSTIVPALSGNKFISFEPSNSLTLF
ncbi:2-phosphosulfolactate phosphatase [Fictibacillus arsenicus]|uniref:Probable 2-phosphosulfolactate phosphatase n=1 Tax=Fictibacillus arsenicus TaxID=255247 RepID=A0A1B1Z7V0_9BACL|nr:2-phosphosulfolactate phosphatase [Fictibacillus arsenicus]ANX13522.1 2-phosphosulfolactate phosphatase [Fictibacillus arsenicus]